MPGAAGLYTNPQDIHMLLQTCVCPWVLACLSRVSSGLQAALMQSFMPTSVRWLPHGLGYFFNLTFTTVRCIPL